MSPEQAFGDVETIGPGCDIYSLGVIMYELLTGRVPFEGPEAFVLGQILFVEPAPPSTYRSDLDPQLEAICLKAIAKSPASALPPWASSPWPWATTSAPQQAPVP